MWISLDYFLVSKKMGSGAIQKVGAKPLVLGVLQIIFGGIIPGILFNLSFFISLIAFVGIVPGILLLIAYGKVSAEAIRLINDVHNA